MMNTREMVGTPVVTRSGQPVGKVASFDLDQATGRLVTLHVKTPGLVPGLHGDELLVSWDAIIEMTPKQVTIMDGLGEMGASAIVQAEPFPAPSS